MATTVEEVARSVLAAYRSKASLTLASQWVRDRFRQVASRSRLRAMRKVGNITIPAPYDTGTVSVVTGSTTVSGSGTTWTLGMRYRHLKLESTWYEISEVNSATSLQLSHPVKEDTDTGLGYTIRERYSEMPDDVAYLGSVVHMPTTTLLRRISLLELDTAQPDRRGTGTHPRVYAEVGQSVNTRRRFEFYPYADAAVVLHMAYWQVPPALGLHDNIPFGIDPWVLREGALIDLYRYEMSLAVEKGDQQAAELLRNEMRTQKTQWDTRDLHELVRSDGGSEDIVFIAEQVGGSMGGDITTAEQQVWTSGV